MYADTAKSRVPHKAHRASTDETSMAGLLVDHETRPWLLLASMTHD